MDDVLVSIIIPVYNVEQYIEKCIDSVLKQTYQLIEIIIVDDASPDSSIHIAEEHIKRHNVRNFKVITIRHNNNLGLASARNTGVSTSNGDFIFHLDADDYLSYNAIEMLVLYQKQYEADIVSCDVDVINTNGTQYIIEPTYSNNMEMTLNLLSQKNCHHLFGRLIRKTLYTVNGIHSIHGINYGEDWIVLPQLSYYAKNIIAFPEPLYHYYCMNINSYTYNHNSKDINYQQKIEIEKKDLKVLYELRNIFKNKGYIYTDAINRFIVKKTTNCLFLSSIKNDLETFRVMKINLKAMEKKYFPHIFRIHIIRFILLNKPIYLHLYLKSREKCARFRLLFQCITHKITSKSV